MQSRTRSTRPPSRSLLLIVATLSACDGVTSFSTDNRLPPAQGAQSLLGPNFAVNPATGRPFVVEPNFGGQAAAVRVLDVVVGRLVDVYDRDPATGARTLRFADLLIGQDIASDGLDFELEQQPVTHKSRLTVLHAFGGAGFAAAFPRLEAGLQPLLIKSLAPSELPPFSQLPRNGALAIRCDDLLDDGGDPGDPGYPGTIRPSNVRVVSGAPPVAPYEARVLPDPNHGDVISGRFHSTRILVDLGVSPLEALANGLAVNLLGLPEAHTTALANAGLRLPTQVNPAAQQLDIVRNLGGAGFSFNGNGATDPFSPTLDVVRACRSGGATSVTGDPFNGFLADSAPPQLLVQLTCNLTQVNPTAVPGEFRCVVRLPDPDCQSRIRVGSVVDVGSHVAEVLQLGATGVKLRLLFGDPATFAPSLGRFTTTWVPWLSLPATCAVRFLPAAGDFPNKLVSNAASVIVAFNEPIDPSSVSAFDTFTVTLPQSSSPLTKYVVGQIVPSLDLTQFSFAPALPLKHVSGSAERYLVDLIGGAGGIRDLAGNALLDDPPQTDFTLEPTQASFDSGGVALRFSSTDEDQNGRPELRGQVIYDLAAQRIVPRPVSRFAASVDASQPVVAAMSPIAVPLQTPLSPYGSKLTSSWRYHDLGFGLLDDATHNLDVESLSWSPFAGAPVADSFAQFQMSFAHGKFLPDEELSSGLLPTWPATGVSSSFASNLADAVNDPLTVVHHKSKGYTVDPTDLFFAPTTGIPLTHWPLNRGVPVSQFNYWTWRDTAKLAVGAPNGRGADTGRLQQVTGKAALGFYPSSQVPTIGLPLLTEIRTYPSAQANGQNGFRVAIAINSSANPYFRAHSTGGVLPSGQVLFVDPDNSPTATGGISPGTGAPTSPRDNVLYYGQADFVVRVSRAHTVWFDTGDASQFAQPVLEPAAAGLPPGTQIQLAFRGASSIASSAPLVPAWQDAALLGPYGDGFTAQQLALLAMPTNLTFTPAYFNTPPNTTDKSWKSNLAALDGARYVQARISFLSNPETNLSPSLSSFAIAFRR